MGQKAHPHGLRLGIIKKHRSCWFESNQYAQRLVEDDLIRRFLSQSLQSAGVTDLIISRTLGNHINVFLKLTKPALFMGAGEQQLNLIRQNLITLLGQQRKDYKPEAILVSDKTQPRVTFYISEMAQPESCATWVANSIVEQLEKRVAWRRAVQKASRRVARAKIPGLKVQISGRLNGAEIARREWVRQGRVPLQTLCADIDYCQTTAQTIYGTLGIKVWVFRKIQPTM
uniref:Small ribosomal subunit protein uS3c n=1 Tax=Pseudobryopsis hainanensis TaxID=2320808 RepID=A0A3S7SY55_9CHLO|nr:ribosomal protein S3 [Pseudobryopsis hainanensis]